MKCLSQCFPTCWCFSSAHQSILSSWRFWFFLIYREIVSRVTKLPVFLPKTHCPEYLLCGSSGFLYDISATCFHCASPPSSKPQAAWDLATSSLCPRLCFQLHSWYWLLQIFGTPSPLRPVSSCNTFAVTFQPNSSVRLSGTPVYLATVLVEIKY